MEKRKLLLGDEAVALGALHAGISGAYAYPGTPSTELFEYIEALKDRHQVHARWSPNEKVAYEEALGVSYAGKRAIVSMKHVGLNVAADPFMNSGVTGVNGGLIVCVADDPGMHSSQNEQDTREFAHFGLIPCIEPVNQQEAYDMVGFGFELSETLKIPVLLRLVTRLAHSRASVVTGPQRPQNALNKTARGGQFTLLPTNARVLYRQLTDKEPMFLQQSEESPYNRLVLPDGHHRIGVISTGIATNYFLESAGPDHGMPHLHIGHYPVPVGKMRALVNAVDEIWLVEEGYPVVEDQLRGVMGVCGKTIRGKRDAFLPRTGELTPGIVARAMGKPGDSPWKPTIDPLPRRPPALCPGCPHSDTFKAMNEATSMYEQPTVTSDIGCYTLAFYPPLNAIETCVDMGASISMATGAVHAGLFPVLCAIGDSTFGHSGITSLLSAVEEDTNMVVFILDNGTVAMTGTQDSLSTGERLHSIVRGLGVPASHIREIVPLAKHHADNVKLIREEIEHKGLSVIISTRPCIQIRRPKPGEVKS